MLLLLGHILQPQEMCCLQTGLILLSKVLKAGLEQLSQEDMQENCCFEQKERTYASYWQELGCVLR
jgi:hypothetical protein